MAGKSPCITENDVYHNGRYPSADDIDGIVGLNVNRGEAHQYEERQDAVEELLVSGAPGKEEQDGADAHMTAGEGRGGALAGIVGGLHALVEESVGIAGQGQALAVCGKEIVHVGEHAVGNVVEPRCQIVVLRSRYRQCDEDDVVDEERGEYDEGRAVELLITVTEIEEGHQRDERIVRGIAQLHQFAENRVGEMLREEQGGLAVEELLLVAGEDMIEVGQQSVELVGVGIPPRQERHLGSDAAEVGETAGHHSVDGPHGHGHGHDAYAPPEHRLGVVHLRVGEKREQQGKCQIAEDDPLDGQQSFSRFLLNLE